MGRPCRDPGQLAAVGRRPRARRQRRLGGIDHHSGSRHQGRNARQRRRDRHRPVVRSRQRARQPRVWPGHIQRAVDGGRPHDRRDAPGGQRRILRARQGRDRRRSSRRRKSTPVARELEAQWSGEFELGGYPRHVTVTLENRADGGASAKLVIVGKRTNDLPVDLVVQQGPLLRIESQASQVTFEGRCCRRRRDSRHDRAGTDRVAADASPRCRGASS